jgi:hypothetical protein
MHGGKAKGAPKGNSYAFKHGRYTTEATAERGEMMALIREMKSIIKDVGGCMIECWIRAAFRPACVHAINFLF